MLKQLILLLLLEGAVLVGHRRLAWLLRFLAACWTSRFRNNLDAVMSDRVVGVIRKFAVHWHLLAINLICLIMESIDISSDL